MQAPWMLATVGLKISQPLSKEFIVGTVPKITSKHSAEIQQKASQNE
jgi:hypothetical protein